MIIFLHFPEQESDKWICNGVVRLYPYIKERTISNIVCYGYCDYHYFCFSSPNDSSWFYYGIYSSGSGITEIRSPLNTKVQLDSCVHYI